MRYSSNTLRNAFELGNSSSWVLAFEGVGANSPNVNNLNLINKQFTPAIDVQYDNFDIKTLNLGIGPGIHIDIPVFGTNHPHTISITCYDSHTKLIREEIKNWVTNKLKITQGKAPILTQLKNSCALLKVHHFDKQLNKLTTDAFYVIPQGNPGFRGDQSFLADTLPINFTVLGTQ